MSSTSILGRCLTLLTILANEPAGMALGDLSKRTGLPKSATHRMLSSLVQAGFVVQSEQSRYYRLTMKLVMLGFRFLGGTGLIEHCQGALDRLAETTQELVRMSVTDNDRLLWIAKSQGARGSVVVDPVMGKNVALHATASGKIWLASLPVEKAAALVLQDGLGTPRIHGPAVIQSMDLLHKELKITRERGYALAWEEADPGVTAIAVGIPSSHAAGARLFGTVSVAGPTFRITTEKLLEFLPALTETANELAGTGAALQYWQAAASAHLQTG